MTYLNLKHLILLLSILALLLASNSFATNVNASKTFPIQAIELSTTEQKWLDSQEQIHFSVTANQEPAAFEGPDGEVKGILIDYFRIVEKLINKKIRVSLVSANPLVVKEKAKELKLHGILAVFKTKVTQGLFLFSNSYLNTPLYVFTTKALRHRVSSKDDLIGKKIAVVKGHQFMLEFVKSIKDIQIIEAKNPVEQMEKLQYGEVDGILGYMTYHHLIRKNLFDNIVPAFSTQLAKKLHVGILPEYAPLVSILNKAISHIEPNVISEIVAKWLNRASAGETDGLTSKELNWLKQQNRVRVRVPYWPPYSFDGDKPIGLSLDYLNSVADRYGINIEYISAQDDWSAALADLKNQRAQYDLLLTMYPTAQRQIDFSLTKPYLTVPWVIFSDKSKGFISGIDDLKGKKVAVERNFVMHHKLLNDYPDIRLVIEKDSLTALEAVSSGKARAYIGNLVNASYLIQSHGLDNLKIAAATPFENHSMSMAVRKDWPELASILDKGISLISPKTQAELKNRWVSVRYEHGITPYTVALWALLVISIAGIIILLVIKVNKTLNREIEQRKQAEEKLAEYIEVIDNNVIISTADPKGIITKVSDAFCRITQYSSQELVGRTHALIKHPDTPNDVFDDLWQTVKARQVWQGEIKNQAKNGEAFWVYAVISPKVDKYNQIMGFTSIYQDISNKKKVERLSITDKLTGLYNRFKLDQALAQEVQRSERYQTPLSIALIDIDHFKSVNDSYGHQKGDTVIQTVAALLKQNLRKTDIAGRWGGEEFLIIFTQSSTSQTEQACEHIRQSIANYDFGLVTPQTASFGISSYQQNDNLESLLSRADKALYRAKRMGRNQVQSQVS